MSSIIKSPITYYNNVQLHYFGKKIKRTMVPVYSDYVSRHANELIQFAGIEKHHRVLDVGCGMGKYTMDMLAKGYKVEGLDLSPFLLQQFLRYNDNRFNVKLHAADILEAPEELNEQFDFVIGYMTLHHLHVLHASFQSMFRLLKPGGKLIFLEPNPYNPLFHMQILFTKGMSYKGEKGLLDMTRNKIYNAMGFSGFIKPRLRRFGFFPPAIYNIAIGKKIDNGLSKIRPLQGIMAFQLFAAEKPL